MRQSNITVLALSAALWLVAGCPKSASPPAAAAADAVMAAHASIPEALAQQIHIAITLLEAGKHREVIEVMCHPEDLEYIRQRPDGIDGILDDFIATKAVELLGWLKAAQQTAPTLESDLATFEVGGPRPVTFTLYEGSWYLKN